MSTAAAAAAAACLLIHEEARYGDEDRQSLRQNAAILVKEGIPADVRMTMIKRRLITGGICHCFAYQARAGRKPAYSDMV
jgi:hypothetical protein